MLRLTLLLCVSMFLALLIGGRDYGQMRPGLAMAARDTVAVPAEATPVATPVLAVASPPARPDSGLSDRLSLPLVVAPAPLAEPAGTQAAAVAEAAPPAEADGTVWLVSAEAVNVREGPSTGDAVLDRLTQDEAVLVLWTDDTGWARIRIEGDGVEGYVYADYLIPAVSGN